MSAGGGAPDTGRGEGRNQKPYSRLEREASSDLDGPQRLKDVSGSISR